MCKSHCFLPLPVTKSATAFSADGGMLQGPSAAGHPYSPKSTVSMGVAHELLSVSETSHRQVCDDSVAFTHAGSAGAAETGSTTTSHVFSQPALAGWVARASDATTARPTPTPPTPPTLPPTPRR